MGCLCHRSDRRIVSGPTAEGKIPFFRQRYWPCGPHQDGGIRGLPLIQKRLVNQQGELPWSFPSSSSASATRRRERRDDTRAARQARAGVSAGSVRRLAGEPGSVLVIGQFDSIHTTGAFFANPELPPAMQRGARDGRAPHRVLPVARLRIATGMASVELADLIVADGDAWQAWLGEHRGPRRCGLCWLRRTRLTQPDSPMTWLWKRRCAMAGSMARSRAGTNTPTASASRPGGPAANGRRATSASSSRLIRKGRMQPADVGQVASAKADGR